MTQERIRGLLSDVAEAVPAPDVAEEAWRRSVRVRRGRVAGTSLLVAGVISAVVAVVGVVSDAQSGTRPSDNEQVAALPPVPDAAKARDPDARIGGASTWIGPSIEEEERLPQVSSVLPPSIELSGDVDATDAPGKAIAVFAASDSDPLESVMLLGLDGEVSRLDLEDGLERTENDEGDSFLPLNVSSLSPDGRLLVFAQQDEVVVYDLVDGERRRFSNQGSESWNVGWVSDGTRIQLVKDLMDPDTGKVEIIPDGDSSVVDSDSRFPVDTAIWPERTTAAGREAQTGTLGETAPPFLADLHDPLLVTVDGPRPALLALPGSEGEHVPSRGRVVDWLDENMVAFQSQDYGTFRVLGWDTRSGAVGQLSEVELPDDWDDGVAATWAHVAP